MAGTSVYDDVIMDHIRNARNYRVLEDADCKATGNNPLCGDEIVVYVNIAVDRISDIAFQCTCCGISMASASIMTQMVKGMHAGDAKTLLREFVTMINSRTESASHDMSAGRLAMLETVRKFPARTRCAALPWVTLEAALNQQESIY